MPDKRETTPSLGELARVANEAHAEVVRVGFEARVRAGKALIAAKAQLGHGEWLPWLAANFKASGARTATDYMRVAANQKRASDLENPSVRKATKLVSTNGSKPRRRPRPPEVEQRQASIDLRPDVWEKFKKRAKHDHGSAAAGLGTLVNDFIEREDRRRVKPTETECGLDDSFNEALTDLERRLDNFTAFRKDPKQVAAIAALLAQYADPTNWRTHPWRTDDANNSPS